MTTTTGTTTDYDEQIDPETTICRQLVGGFEDGDLCGEPAVATDLVTGTGRCAECLAYGPRRRPVLIAA